LSWSFQSARGEDFSTEPNYGRPYVVMGRPLHSAAVVSSFFLFSSFILSSRRLDIYHTSTHDVALVRI